MHYRFVEVEGGEDDSIVSPTSGAPKATSFFRPFTRRPTGGYWSSSSGTSACEASAAILNLRGHQLSTLRPHPTTCRNG